MTCIYCGVEIRPLDDHATKIHKGEGSHQGWIKVTCTLTRHYYVKPKDSSKEEEES